MARARLRLPVLPLRTWLLGSHLVVLVLPVLALLLTGALGSDLRRQTADDIDHQAALLALHGGVVGLPASDAEAEAWCALLNTAKARTLAGFRVVDRGGVVVATSGELSGLGADLSGEPEVTWALTHADQATWAEARFRGRSLEQPLSGPSRRSSVRLFVAEPVFVAGELAGAVVVSRTPREELQAFWHMAPRLSAGVAVALLLTVLLALNSGWVVSRSLRGLAAASGRMAGGALDAAPELEDARGSRVAEARDLAHAMGRMAGQLRARLRYISEFASHVSHEFKTPVSSLRGTVELLRDDDEMPPAQRARFLDNALSDLDRLSRLVSGLLTLARAEEGGERQPVDLDALARGVASRHPGVAVSGAAAAVRGDTAQLASAVSNLLDNARRYGGPEATITLRLWADEAETGVEVCDDGPGISEANQARVFERFFTTGRAHGGTGLGLALVSAVAQAHGGAVSVASAPGRTVFRVALPREG